MVGLELLGDPLRGLLGASVITLPTFGYSAVSRFGGGTAEVPEPDSLDRLHSDQVGGLFATVIAALEPTACGR